MSADEAVAEGRFKWIEYRIQQALTRATAAIRALAALSNAHAAENGGTIGPAGTVAFQQALDTPGVSNRFLVSGQMTGTGTAADTIVGQLTFNGTPFGPLTAAQVSAGGIWSIAIENWIDSSGVVGTPQQYGIHAIVTGSPLTVPTHQAVVTTIELP